ncbi:MAG: hypothetical protein RJA22_1565 [Verrucomicrobiota bacterium]
MDREQLDTGCERAILALVMAVVVFAAAATGAARPQDFVVVQWLTVALLGVWVARFFINPKHRLLWPPVCWPVLAFVGYAVGRYLTADVEFLARQEMIRILVYAVLFFAVVNNLHKQEPSQIMGLTLVFLAAAIAGYALFQFLTGSDYVWNIPKPEGMRKRGSGTFYSPNHAACFLAMVLPLALSFTLTGRFTPVMRVVLGYAAIVIFAGLTVTFSRGGWVAAAVSLVALFFWMVRQRDFWKQSVLVLLLMGAVFGVALTRARSSPDRFERFTLARQFEDVRFRLWEPARQMWRDHFWFGVGPNHFDTRFRAYRPADVELQGRPERVHNDYLNTLVDWGVVGGALVLACWGAFFFQVFHGWKHVQRSQNDLGSRHSNRTSFVLGGSLGLLALLVHSFTDFNLHIPAVALLAVALMALVTGYYRFASERYWHTLRLPLRCVVLPVLAAGLAYLGWQSWRRTVECVRLDRVQEVHRAIQRESASATPERLGELGRQQLAALEAAAAAEPANFETAYELGEALRLQSFAGLPGYEALAERALTWFQKASDLNPYHPHPYLGRGMSLQWLQRGAEAAPAFAQANRLDPNGYFTLARLGWYEFQQERYEAAVALLNKSMSLCSDTNRNPLPAFYIDVARQRQTNGGPGPVLR